MHETKFISKRPKLKEEENLKMTVTETTRSGIYLQVKERQCCQNIFEVPCSPCLFLSWTTTFSLPTHKQQETVCHACAGRFIAWKRAVGCSGWLDHNGGSCLKESTKEQKTRCVVDCTTSGNLQLSIDSFLSHMQGFCFWPCVDELASQEQ
jgi:hypothetical protein